MAADFDHDFEYRNRQSAVERRNGGQPASLASERGRRPRTDDAAEKEDGMCSAEATHAGGGVHWVLYTVGRDSCGR